MLNSPILSLHQIRINKISPSCWCATAMIADEQYPNLCLKTKRSQNHTQRLAVRRLLQLLLAHLDKDNAVTINRQSRDLESNDLDSSDLKHQCVNGQQLGGDELDDSAFPYRLKNSGHFVCFSHSNNMVAISLSGLRPTGIDIEVNPVTLTVAARFFHPDEVAYLNDLKQRLTNPSQAEAIIAMVCKYLWQIKECVIKIAQLTLIAALKISYSFLLPKLVMTAQKHINNAHTLNPTSIAINDIVLLHHRINIHDLLASCSNQQLLANGNFDNALKKLKAKKSTYQIAILLKQQTVLLF